MLQATNNKAVIITALSFVARNKIIQLVILVFDS